MPIGIGELRLHDHHANGRVNLRVQPDRNGVLAELLERVFQLDLSLVHHMARLGQLVGNILGGDGAEEPVALARLAHDGEGDAGEPVGRGLGLAPSGQGLGLSRFLFPSVAS